MTTRRRVRPPPRSPPADDLGVWVKAIARLLDAWEQAEPDARDDIDIEIRRLMYHRDRPWRPK